MLASQASKIGDFDTAWIALRRLEKKGVASPRRLKELAWIALMRDSVNEGVREYALHACQRATENKALYLNTLASVYAAEGNSKEALNALYRCVDARGGEPHSDDWCVLGRIAENYGLYRIAKSLYEKVPHSRNIAANNSAALAKRRLEIISLEHPVEVANEEP